MISRMRGRGWLWLDVVPAAAALALVGGFVLSLAGRAPLASGIWRGGLLITGVPLVVRTLIGAFRGRFAADLVAALAILGALILGQPVAGLVIVLMQSGGEALERYAAGRASEAVRHLEDRAPRQAHRIEPGGIRDIAADAVDVGDSLMVRPGEMVPCDGVVVEGSSHVDTASLTGEPLARRVSPGAALMSGSLNQESPLTVRATARSSESQYARIIELVRSAQASKAPIQRMADRYAVWFTPLTLAVCGLTWLATGDATRVLAILVVATPCPLILAVPVAIIGGINRAAGQRIIVRSGGALERLAAVDSIVFDKTGTLTVGRPVVERVHATAGSTAPEVMRLAAALEERSSHLLARSIVEAAGDGANGARAEARSVVEDPGRGISGSIDGRNVRVGSRSFVLDGIDAPAAFGELDQAAGLRAYVSVDGRPAAFIEFADRHRDDLAASLEALRERGMHQMVLLSGDSQRNVDALAAATGISDARGDLAAEDKVTVVREMSRRGRRVLMVGDGTNDAPALAEASVGIALAAHGGGITAEAADVVLLADDLALLPRAIDIGRRTLRIAHQSVWAGLGLSALAMAGAAAGVIAPVPGAFIQEGIDLAVILNALRAARSPGHPARRIAP